MPYVIEKANLDALGLALSKYYEEAWHDGIKGLFDNMARQNMGVGTAYLDVAKDTFAGLKKKSNDSFGIQFKPALTKYLSVALANKNDVYLVLVTIAEKALTHLTSYIPVPHLSAVLNAGISAAAGQGRAELHSRSIVEADTQLAAKSGTPIDKLFTNDVQAEEFVTKSINQYKLICKYITTMPASISSFDDAVTFPGAVFKVQAAASSLNVALDSVLQYIIGMQARLANIQAASKEYIDTVRRGMPSAVNVVLQNAYSEAYKKGEDHIRLNKYSAPASPTLQSPSQTGGATQLAAFLAHAVAKGYYDAGNTGVQLQRPRAGAVSMPGRR